MSKTPRTDIQKRGAILMAFLVFVALAWIIWPDESAMDEFDQVLNDSSIPILQGDPTSGIQGVDHTSENLDKRSQDAGTVKVHVTRDNFPVPEHWVVLLPLTEGDSISLRTDTFGTAKFDKLTCGKYQVKTSSRTHGRVLVRASRLVNINIALKDTRDYRVLVVDENNKPLPKSDVFLCFSNSRIPPLLQGITTEDGILELSNATGSLRAVKAGYQESTTVLLPTQQPQDTVIKLVVKTKGVRFTGRVLGSGNRSIPDASVTLSWSRGLYRRESQWPWGEIMVETQYAPRLGLTTQSGDFSFEHLVPGRYYIKVVVPGYDVWRGSVDLRGKTQASKTIEMLPGWDLRLQVQDKTGQVQEGVEVNLRGSGPRRTKKSDAQGIVTFQVLTPGSVKITANAKLFKPFKATFEGERGQSIDEKIQLASKSGIALTLRDGRGTPLHKFSAFLLMGERESVVSVNRSDKDGFLFLPADSDELATVKIVHKESPWSMPILEETVQLIRGQIVFLTLTMDSFTRATSVIRGTISPDFDREAMGVRFDLFSTSNLHGIFGNGKTLKIDETGHFEYEGLPPGTWHIAHVVQGQRRMDGLNQVIASFVLKGSENRDLGVLKPKKPGKLSLLLEEPASPIEFVEISYYGRLLCGFPALTLKEGYTIEDAGTGDYELKIKKKDLSIEYRHVEVERGKTRVVNL